MIVLSILAVCASFLSLLDYFNHRVQNNRKSSCIPFAFCKYRMHLEVLSFYGCLGRH
jgi:hypothetical protein